MLLSSGTEYRNNNTASPRHDRLLTTINRDNNMFSSFGTSLKRKTEPLKDSIAPRKIKIGNDT